MNILKILAIAFYISALFSCNNKKEIDGKRFFDEHLANKTFLRLTEGDVGLFLYHYCDGVPSYKFKKELYTLFSGDVGDFDILKMKKDKNILEITSNYSYLRKEKEYTQNPYKLKVEIIDSIKHIFKINASFYIDSLCTNQVEYIKQPCTDCFEKEMCDEWAREAKEKEAEVRYDQLRDSLQKLNTQIPEKWQGVYNYLVSDEGLTAGGSSTSVWETFTVTQDSIISERQGYMADFTDNYLPAIKYPDTLYMYLDRCLNRDGKPKYYSSSLKPDVLYKKGDTFYLNDRKLDYRPLNE